MKPLLDLKGIITVLNTPFTDADRIDLAAVRRNVRLALEARVAGFLIPAMASEVGKLSDAERAELLETVLDEVAGAVPVIGGASAATSDERCHYAARCIALGCPGVLVSIPYETPEHYETEVRRVADLGPGFLMLQDWDFQGYGLPVSLIVKLFDAIDCFRCLKVEVVPAGRKYSEILEATGGRLHVSGGWAVMQMIEALDRGVHAFMPTAMHPLYTRIYALYQSGDRAAAARLFNRLLPVLAFSNQHLDISIHFFKQLLYRQGVFATPRVRQPILPFDPHHQRIADELIQLVNDLTAEITNGRSSPT